jgi:hypothetical protein
MLCGWGCGGWLTGRDMRAHFTRCPKRPAESDDLARRPTHLALLNQILGRSKPKRGRPPGRRMLCGWRCGARVTASGMRKHFTLCSKRPKN